MRDRGLMRLDLECGRRAGVFEIFSNAYTVKAGASPRTPKLLAEAEENFYLGAFGQVQWFVGAQ
jgi:hypothetical protein